MKELREEIEQMFARTEFDATDREVFEAFKLA